ncbi:heliorhodopsin HeR [Candidatus Dojkabacteria bacterium]|nr:heliorhodopsin HeR [Candidatus Dojkabacteria bacterium]
MDKYRNLRIFNLVMGVFHLVQAIVMLLVSNDFTLPLDTNFLKFSSDVMILQPERETILNIRVAPLLSLFLVLSAVSHFTLTLPLVYEWYVKNLKRGINYARWYEYSLSASLMIVLIAMLVGVYDIGSLILMFSINACMIFFGLVMELHNQSTKMTNWTSFIYGCFAGAIPWVVIALYLFGSGEGEAKPPDFVYWIFFSIFLFFNTFAVNMFLQYKKFGKWKDYLWGERVYILLSLLAKSALAWQVFGGTLRPV